PFPASFQPVLSQIPAGPRSELKVNRLPESIGHCEVAIPPTPNTPIHANRAFFANHLNRLLSDLEQQGLARKLSGPLPDHISNFSSNDYLGFSSSPKLIDAARNALSNTVGAGAARLIGGNSLFHQRLESRLCQFKQTEASLLFSTGYHANVGTLPALVDAKDAVFSDALNHASIVDGCRISRAKIHIYRHLDLDDLEKQLIGATNSKFRHRLIVTDAVFGMDGDCAPLSDLASLASRFGCQLMVDEAHATGVYGPAGRGLVAEANVHVDLHVTTFGKALGTFGAAALSSRVIIDHLINNARTFIFTTALPPCICAATHAAIDLLESPEGDRLRGLLKRNTQLLQNGLNRLGFSIRNPTSPIHPLLFSSAHAAIEASAALLKKGFFVQAIRPPTVPRGTSRLRIAVSALHEPEQIDGLIFALSEIFSSKLVNP
ncbi:MAG: 8-amino-7-oxononanoate synthase, partial [Pseudomonadota bacterium]